MEDCRPVLPLPPASPMWQGLPAEGEWCKAGHDSHVCTLLRLQYPPRHHYGLLSYPCSSGLLCSLLLAPRLLTCLSPTGTRSCPQLLPGRLHPDTRLFLGGGNDGDRRGLLGPLGLVPWQAPPLRNAIELFGGMKRLPVQPLGSPVPFSPCTHRAAGGANLYSSHGAIGLLYPPLQWSHF